MRFALTIACSLIPLVPAYADGQIRGVVELFTSQGCSSCPPADAVIEELAREDGLAVLSLPVDYWDRLGWKDTYGSPAHTERQRAYAITRGDGEVYTPQAVVNGSRHMNGADRAEIEQNLAQLRSTLRVGVDLTRESGVLRVAVGAAPSGAAAAATSATVVLMPFLARREVAVGRGENAKRRIAYTNIVRRIDVLGQWTGEARNFEVPVANADGAEGVVALLQSGTPDAPGPILGAALIAFDR